MNFVDLTGLRFGKLEAIERTGNDKRGRAMWRCRCDCGNEKVAASYLLKTGCTRSCGCIRSEAQKLAKAIQFADSLFDRRLHRIWYNMIGRCHRANDKQFKMYGARGVFVSQEWRESYSAFALWAGDRHAGLTIDRIDPSGPYSPDNCRWADHMTQQNNRRKHVWVEFEGERLTATQLARKLGVTPWKIYNGIKDKGDPFGYIK